MDERYRSQQPLLPLLSIAASRPQYSPPQQWAQQSTSQLPTLGMSERKDSTNGHEDSMSSTSDFVKKLLQNVVSWGPQGDCFVVKDMNEFTKSILPRMFKHSNFASFVRQLNKYDFHKVKNTDDNQFGEHSWTFRHPDFHADRRDALENIKRKVPAQRKSTGAAASAVPLTPASGYPPPANYPQAGPSSFPGGNYDPANKVDTMQNQIASLQSQLTSLGAAHEEVLSHVRNLERSYQEVLVEMVGFQRGMAQQDGLMQNLIQYFLRENNGNGAGKMKQLSNNDAWMREIIRFCSCNSRRRRGYWTRTFLSRMWRARRLRWGCRFGGQSSNSGVGGGVGSSSNSRLGGGVGASGIGAAMSRMDMLSRIEELQAQRRSRMNTPIYNSSSTLSSTSGAGQQQQMVVEERSSSTPESSDFEDEVVQPTASNPPSLDVALPDNSDAWSLSTGDSHAGLEVYTVGHLMPRGGSFLDGQGGWSFDAGRCPYPNTGSPSNTSGSPPQQKQTLRVRRSTFVPGWAVPPRVLLVDDDAVSRKLSSKFLQVFGCTTDVAVDGVGAVNKMNLEKYDLVLMGCRTSLCRNWTASSATSMIRKFDPATPIISMTSNSRPNEIMTYYSSVMSLCMNDILPKPFTKEGLFDMLEKHLQHLTVIKEKMSTTMRIPRQPTGIPPLNDAGFESALQAGAASSSPGSSTREPCSWATASAARHSDGGRINVLAGMGLSDEQYNVMLASIVSGDGFNFGEKRTRDDEVDTDSRDNKRSRFEVIE
ncbi:response regulatory domain-containing protein [Favolaschia claudopus]|uniref:Transcription factor n=1 Tax=Favolaschia claudopus TaxID=2862362 RepID=A0AAW0CBV3_9AGAR